MKLSSHVQAAAPIATLAVAVGAAFLAQSVGGAVFRATHSTNVLLCVASCGALVLAARGSRHANLAVWVAAAIGVRCLYAAQPTLPLPAAAWARGMGVNPPRQMLAAIFSNSVFGVGQLCGLLLACAALSASGCVRRVERIPVAVLGLIGAIGAVTCVAVRLPVVTNVLTVASAGTVSQGYAVPAWVDGAVVQRVWSRVNGPDLPGVQNVGLLIDNEMALGAIAEGMAMSSSGESVLREGLWGAARALTWVQLWLRVVAALLSLIAVPMFVGLAFRSADRARVLAVPGAILLWLLGAGNVALGLLACFLPEGGAAAVRTLPFHLALLGFVGAATLATWRLRST
ncbi:MAG: hypothetical protein EXR69_05830 [Myxococcales bacterium]|nr:hypothetical protein [Myxococcales bacterium]